MSEISQEEKLKEMTDNFTVVFGNLRNEMVDERECVAKNIKHAIDWGWAKVDDVEDFVLGVFNGDGDLVCGHWQDEPAYPVGMSPKFTMGVA